MSRYSLSAAVAFVLVFLCLALPVSAAGFTDVTGTPTETFTELPTVSEPTLLPTVTQPTELPTVTPPTDIPTAEPTSPAPTETSVPGGGNGYIWVYSNVDGAVASFSPGSYSCTVSGGSCSVTVSPTGTPATSFTVQKDGYETYYGQVTQWPSDGATVYYTATLSPIATTVPTTVAPGGDKGYIWVYCNADGALVSFSPGTSVCEVSGGFCSVEVSTTATPFTSFTVTKSGYDSYYGSVNLWPSGGETVYYTAVLNPVNPTTGTLYVATTPGSAAVYLNGNFQGYSPYTITDLAPGTYSVMARRSGYDPASQSVTVYSGQVSTAYLTLSRSSPSSTGTLYVSSNPGSALVYVDGLYSGLTPLTTTLTTGTHSVLIQKTGYSYWSGTTVIPANSRQTIQATLQPAADGWITIQSSPVGATIYLDNSYKGQTNSNGVLTISNVYPGLHVLKAVAPGYDSYTTTVNVDAKARTYVPIRMTVQQGVTPTPQPGYSGIAITSDPSGADVFLDNVAAGVTPLTLTTVTPGQHTVLVQKSGYQDEQILLQTTMGTIFPLELTLIPGESPSPTKSAETSLLVPGALAALAIILYYKRES